MNEFTDFKIMYDNLEDEFIVYAQDTIPWIVNSDDNLEHLSLLQDKLNGILSIIENNELPTVQTEEENLQINKITIECLYYPSQAAIEIIEYFQEEFKKIDYTLKILSDRNKEN